MPFTLTSTVSSGPLLVPLTSGTVVRLSPGQVSEQLDDVEVVNQPRIEKLAQRGLLRLQRVDVPPAETPTDAADRGAGRRRGRKEQADDRRADEGRRDGDPGADG
jgi:hypothetical protein